MASGRVGDRGGSLDRAAAPQPAAPKPAASTPAKNVVEVKAPPQAQAPPPETAPKILPAQAAAGLETAAEKAPQAGE